MNYENLKATIAANIYTNGNQEVTAAMVKTAMNEVVNTLGAGYQYMGVAHPDDAAASYDQHVFFIATEPGTYTNRGGLQVAEGEVAILKYDTAWHKEGTGAATAAQVTALGQKVECHAPFITGDIVGIGKFIRELYITGLPTGTTYVIRNFAYNSGTNKLTFQLGTSSGYAYGVSFNLNGLIQSASDHAVTITIVLQNWDELTGSYVGGNANTSRYVINRSVCEDIRYSPIIYAGDLQALRDNVNSNTQQLAPIDSVDINGYLQANGTIGGAGSYVGKMTGKLSCKPGEVYLYRGRGEYNGVSCLFYLGDTIVSNDKINDTTNYNEITIPSGVDGVVFASYASTGNSVVLDVIKKNPASIPYVILSSEQKSALYAKSVSWDGDSIAYGVGYAGGYAGIISARASMSQSNNEAEAGATIAKNTYYYVAWTNGGTTYYTRFRYPSGGSKAYTNTALTTGEVSIDSVTSSAIVIGGVSYSFDSANSHARHWLCDSVSSLPSADFIILEGGVNDSWNDVQLGSLSPGYGETLDEDTFYGAFESMLKKALQTFPGKKVGYVATHRGSSDWSLSGAYYQAAIECCKKWGIPVCDLMPIVPPFGSFPVGSSLRTSLTDVYTDNGDGLHPNEAGYKAYYCDKIEAWMKTL